MNWLLYGDNLQGLREPAPGGIGRLLFSLAIIGIGLETLICVTGHKIVPVIPWVSAIPALACTVGVIFILSAAGLLFRRTLPVSSIAIGVVMSLCGLAFDVPRHPDLMSAPWRTNVLEPITIACLAWLAAVDSIPGWLDRTSRYLIAFALVTFGIAHFQVLSFIAQMVPGWIPWHSFWTVFFGLALICGGIGFALRPLQQWAAFGIGLMFAIWALTIHLPALLAHPNADNWSDVFIVVALWGGFWALVVGNGQSAQRNTE